MKGGEGGGEGRGGIEGLRDAVGGGRRGGIKGERLYNKL